MPVLSWRSKKYTNGLWVFLMGAGTTPYSVATLCGHVIVVWPSIQKQKIKKQKKKRKEK